MNSRGWKDPAWIVSRTIVPTDAELGHRALRAMRLVDRTQVDPSAGSSELANAHLERTLGRAQPTRLARAHLRWGAGLQRGALLAGIAALAAGRDRSFSGHRRARCARRAAGRRTDRLRVAR